MELPVLKLVQVLGYRQTHLGFQRGDNKGIELPHGVQGIAEQEAVDAPLGVVSDQIAVVEYRVFSPAQIAQAQPFVET